MDARTIRIVRTRVQYRNVLATKAKVESCRATNFRKRASDSASVAWWGVLVSPAISAIIPSRGGGRHIPDTAYTACGADVRILQ